MTGDDHGIEVSLIQIDRILMIYGANVSCGASFVYAALSGSERGVNGDTCP